MLDRLTHPAPSAAADRYGRSRIGATALLGVVLWLEAAMFIRYGAPSWLFAGTTAGLALFGLTIPLAWMLVWCLQRILPPQGSSELVVGVAVVAGAACLCDAVALTWQPTLYGDRPGELLPAFAWLFWFVGVSLFLAVAMGRHRAG